MNGKKARGLRQLVEHLQSREPEAVWCAPGYIEHSRPVKGEFVGSGVTITAPDGQEVEKTKQKYEVPVQRVLKEDCGRAIYQRMKKSAILRAAQGHA